MRGRFILQKARRIFSRRRTKSKVMYSSSDEGSRSCSKSGSKSSGGADDSPVRSTPPRRHKDGPFANLRSRKKDAASKTVEDRNRSWGCELGSSLTPPPRRNRHRGIGIRKTRSEISKV
eukprot:TRINITY_DN5274_c0_g1_i1.p1 TRINITY_DN5274_c0_g1~~TRINITY_DN5274_c0_g1_i1.p1  ORF type:complete len:119 (-),score=11.21 TRINITY_DN5274_c0_g1_i1:119-475(-)